jgi:2-methylcitrate dehydratase PrpD
MTEINFTNALASHCLAIGNDAISSDIYRIASHSLLDWIAVGRSAWKEPALQIPLACCIEEGGNPQATLLSGDKASYSQAALLNGIASHIFDFDDVHLRSRVHPSVPLWSAILAEGERMNVPVEQLLRAFIVGVEMQSRLAFAMGEDHYKLGWHNTATLGAFGASAAVAYLKGMTASELGMALGICGTQAAGLRIAFGTMCKPLHAGKAALTGLNSAQYAAKGFNGPKDIFDAPGGIFALYANHSSLENALDKPLLLRVVEFNLNIEPERKRIGLIAQEVELIVPEVVRTSEDDGLKSIEYQNLVGLLIESIKELNNKVSRLENIIIKNNLN